MKYCTIKFLKKQWNITVFWLQNWNDFLFLTCLTLLALSPKVEKKMRHVDLIIIFVYFHPSQQCILFFSLWILQHSLIWKSESYRCFSLVACFILLLAVDVQVELCSWLVWFGGVFQKGWVTVVYMTEFSFTLNVYFLNHLEFYAVCGYITTF